MQVKSCWPIALLVGLTQSSLTHISQESPTAFGLDTRSRAESWIKPSIASCLALPSVFYGLDVRKWD